MRRLLLVFVVMALMAAMSMSASPAMANTLQVPVHIPINVCGNIIHVISQLNPAFGNTCANV